MLTLTKTCTVCGEKYTAHSNARKYCDKCRVIKYHEMDKRRWTKANAKVQAREYSVRTKDKSQCLICGAWVKAPAMHAYQKHRVTAYEYKEAFDLPFGKGLLPTSLKEIKRDHVFDNHTVDNLKKGKGMRFHKGEERVFEGVKRRLHIGQISRLRIKK